MKIIILYLVIFFFPFTYLTAYAQVQWSVQKIVDRGRIDAIADLGEGIVVAGTRWPNPAIIFRSTDYGVTWKKVKTITKPKGTYHDNEILCLMRADNDYAYFITSNAQFWRSKNKGVTWERTAQLGGELGKASFSYSISVTPAGTVLVTSGKNIYRSTDRGSHFEKISSVSSTYLYRLQVAENIVFANGWEGVLYKSLDDGKTWKSVKKMGPSTDPFKATKDLLQTQPYLTAIDCIGGDNILLGTMDGKIFKVNGDINNPVRQISKVKGSLDDFAYLGDSMIIGSTFTGEKCNYISFDSGANWKNIGSLPTGVKGDWWDHIIGLNRKDSLIVIGGSHEGFICAIPIHALQSKTWVFLAIGRCRKKRGGHYSLHSVYLKSLLLVGCSPAEPTSSSTLMAS